MKKQVGLIAVLITLVYAISGFCGRIPVAPVKATYVEGPITQDTLWTLVDSPLVVSKDITVYPNATLTIEPGVEVQFGGNFSISVQGRLIAIGTPEERILFTSNKYEPESGDWKTIDFAGSQLSSMVYCSVEYASDGISVTSGNVTIESCVISNCIRNGIAAIDGDSNILNCNISLCLESGINASSSRLIVQGNIIMQNNASGLLISGDCAIVVQRNTIIGNTEGVVLTGNYTAGVAINQNIIAANGDGVLISADVHTNIAVTNNTISSNKNGLTILTPTSTYISDNSVSYNENGFVYNEGTHTAYRNDVYGNGVGMEAAENSTVMAESNYWGDTSGPYHVSLNPYGRGNPVVGSSTTIDFIFYLTEPIGYVNARPTAQLMTDRVLVRPNDPVMFFATNSSDDGHVDRFLFDFDDGRSTGWTTLSVFTHEYSAPGTYHANVTAMDDFGAISLKKTATVSVQNLPPLYVVLDVGVASANETTQVPVVVHVTDGSGPIENANVTMLSVKGGIFTSPSGLTNATGHFASIFTTPDTEDISYIRIVARASFSGHVEGSDYEYLEIVPFLVVQVSPSSSAIKSEESTPVTVYVSSNGQPVANAYLALSVDVGALSSKTGITDSDGTFSSLFTAPVTTQSLSSIVAASAKKEGYVDGSNNALISIGPKVLDVHILADYAVAFSGAMLNMTVRVEYEMTPTEGANVTIETQNGTLSLSSGSTDINGSLLFGVTVPAVKTPTQIVVTASASASGYAGNQGQITVTVNPKTCNITFELSKTLIEAEQTATVTVRVMCNEDGKPIVGAWITMSASDGNFSEPNGVTDSLGSCTFVFNSPQTMDQISVIIAANVTANGYVDHGDQTAITVTPKVVMEANGGFPMWTLLLILIPVIIVVVVAVLIKRKVITISSTEEE